MAPLVRGDFSRRSTTAKVIRPCALSGAVVPGIERVLLVGATVERNADR